VISEEFREFGSVGGVFVDTEFEVFGELLVEFFVVFSVFGNIAYEFDAFLDNIFFDDFKNFILLQKFSGNVQGKIFRVDNSFDEAEEIGNEFLAIVHDENSSNIEFDVILLFLGFEKIEGSSLGNEQDGLEFKLTLN